MLPAPPTPAHPWLPVRWPSPPSPLLPDAWPGRRPWAALLALLLSALVGLGLAGCSGIGQPSQGVLLRALGLQIALTQRSIASALALEPTGLPQVSRVRVERQEQVAIAEGAGLHLSGRFDWRLADDPIRVDSPFELWLQRGERGQVWRLARPLPAPGREGAGIDQGGLAQDWLIDPLPLPGESAG